MRFKNKSTAFLFCAGGIAFVLCLVIGIIALRYQNRQEETAQTTETESSDPAIVTGYSRSDVFYSEGDEDGAYNYISNFSMLKNTELPYVGTVSLNDRIDEYLKAADYISEKLEITNVTENGTYIYFDISIGDTGDILKSTYDIRYDSLDMYIMQ